MRTLAIAPVAHSPHGRAATLPNWAPCCFESGPLHQAEDKHLSMIIGDPMPGLQVLQTIIVHPSAFPLAIQHRRSVIERPNACHLFRGKLAPPQGSSCPPASFASLQSALRTWASGPKDKENSHDSRCNHILDKVTAKFLERRQCEGTRLAERMLTSRVTPCLRRSVHATSVSS